MPQSKHRHKSGGKATKRLGAAAKKEMRDLLIEYFKESYFLPFCEKFRDNDPCDSQSLLLYFTMLALGQEDIVIAPVEKNRLFGIFTSDIGDGSLPRTTETAEAALAFLIEERMILIDGDQITVHPRFLADDAVSV